MAAPACPLAETFRPFPPLGHGLAAGTMIWMGFSEHVPKAAEKVDSGSAAAAVTLALSATMDFETLVLAH